MDKVFVPPIKIQGIKTKIVGLISDNIFLERDSIWYEPFMGSGVVGLNLAPSKAVFSDINPYVIELYNEIKNKNITSKIVREYLEEEGEKLKRGGAEHYYYIRERFNTMHDPLDFLFLNRSCFNGVIRFNKHYKFNVPYGHKPERFSKSYITKIVNQVKHLESVFPKNDWEFVCCSFEETIARASKNDFIYCDPPYIGRHVDYYDNWDEEREVALHNSLMASSARYMLSTWDHNNFRKNKYIETVWGKCYKTTQEHFYYVGAKENNRNAMVEAILTNYNPAEIQNRGRVIANGRDGRSDCENN